MKSERNDDNDLEENEIKMMATCQSFSKGNIVSWNREKWDVSKAKETILVAQERIKVAQGRVIVTQGRMLVAQNRILVAQGRLSVVP